MINEVIDRLQSEAPDLVAVLAAEDLDALSKGTAPKSGTVFVIPYREQATPNELGMGGFEQNVQVQILIAFVVRRHDDAKGGKRVLDFDAIKNAIEQAIAGWSFDPHVGLFELVAAQAAPLGNGTTVYVQTWETSRTLEVN